MLLVPDVLMRVGRAVVVGVADVVCVRAPVILGLEVAVGLPAIAVEPAVRRALRAGGVAPRDEAVVGAEGPTRVASLVGDCMTVSLSSGDVNLHAYFATIDSRSWRW